MLYVTGDCHGERNYFLNPNSAIDRTLNDGDKLFICGDFGYVMRDSFEERRFLEWLRVRVDYGRWYFGHLHQDKDSWNDQTAVFYQVRNMITNELIEEI
ncbi:hypothetical protein RFF05_13110 [Bengtsoniella intestinalis]|uniref:hypothetical protein n=1 Tax=Bengtsoniella intestinalis TaxID=3073143 RepID=UPI00391F4551